MNLRQALIEQSPSLELQRAAQAEIAKLDDELDKAFVKGAGWRRELIALRISLARLAQEAGIPEYADLSYEEMHRRACAEERGWNLLAQRIGGQLIDNATTEV